MCAHSVAPIVVRFSQEITLDTFQMWLDAAWSSLRNGSTGLDLSATQGALDRLPEFGCDDSSMAAYWVSQALATLYGALAVIGDDKTTFQRHAVEACERAGSRYKRLDFILKHGRRTVFAPRSPLPPGRLESLFMELQCRAVQEVRRTAQPSREFIDRMRHEAGRLAYECDLVLPVCAEEMRWTLSGRVFSDAEVDRVSYLNPGQLKFNFDQDSN
jgi:hypothetical protein